MSKQQGFSIAEVSIVCVVVLLVGALGYVFYNKWVQGASQPQTAQTTSAVPTIASTQDLSKAETVLDSANLSDDTTLSDLDSQLNSF